MVNVQSNLKEETQKIKHLEKSLDGLKLILDPVINAECEITKIQEYHDKLLHNGNKNIAMDILQ